MDYYMKWETFLRGAPISGKAVTIFEAANLPDALREAAKMMEHPSVPLFEAEVEHRITVGSVVSAAT